MKLSRNVQLGAEVWRTPAGWGWSAVNCDDRSWCPPDVTCGPPSVMFPGHVQQCGAVYGFVRCTRGPGHSGRHAAGDGDRIVAVWP